MESDNVTKYITFYSNSKTETIINESDIDDVFELIYTTIVSDIQKYLEKYFVWIIDSALDHNINTSKYKPLADSTCIKLPKELHHPRKGLNNIENNNDDECFDQCLVRYLHPAHHNLKTIRKGQKLQGDKLHFKDTKFTVKVRDIQKIEIFGYEDKEKYLIYVSKNVVKISMLIYD